MAKIIISYKMLQDKFPDVVYNHVNYLVKTMKINKEEIKKIEIELSKATSREEFANIIHNHFGNELKILL